jgi:hypothetical protein
MLSCSGEISQKETSHQAKTDSMFISKLKNHLRRLAGIAAFAALATTAHAHISGTVFCDLNGNGLLDPGEPGISGVRVTLCAQAEQFTDANGFYAFSGLQIDPCVGSSVVAVDTTSVTGDCNVPACPTSMVLTETPAVNVNFCFKKTPPPEEGCSAKFWKDHKSLWVGYTEETVINTVFVNATKLVCAGYGDEGKKKFRDMIGVGTATGNLKDAFKNLMREAIAAVLNAAHPQVNYPATEAEIIVMVNDVLAQCDIAELISLANDLKTANNAGSPLCAPASGTGNCTTDGKPNSLTLTYTGGSCATAVNSQPVGTKYICSESNGGLTGVSPVRIIVSSSSSLPTATSTRFFDGTVAIGGSFNALGSFGANTYFFIYENGVLKQTVQMHTSCSAPLIRTETFGGLRLDDYAIVP